MNTRSLWPGRRAGLGPRRTALLVGAAALGVTIAACGTEPLTGPESDPCSGTATIEIGNVANGSLGSGDCQEMDGRFRDRWAVRIPRDMTVRIDLSSQQFDTWLTLQDARGYPIAENDDAGGTLNSRIVMQVTAGDHEIVATSFQPAAGSYRLEVEEAPACGPGTPIELGVDVNGELTDDDCYLTGMGTADSYVLELDEETAVDFVLKSVEFPPVLLVRDDERREVVVGYEYTTMGTATARAVLSAGSYEVLPTSYYGEARGEYRLTVSEASCGEPIEIRPDDTVSGTLTERDCVLENSHYRDSWSLVVDTTTTVQVDLTSSDFDAYLVLRDDEGTEIDADDDGGSGTNARIVRELDAGTYEVLVSTWGPYQYGGYQLAVSATGAGASATSSRVSAKPQRAAAISARGTTAGEPVRSWGERSPK